MNIYLRTILSAVAILVFIVAWLVGSVIRGIGTGLVAISAAVHRQTEKLLDWVNPARRNPLIAAIEPEDGGPCCDRGRDCTCAYDAAKDSIGYDGQKHYAPPLGPPTHPNCRCDPLDRSCSYVGGDPAAPGKDHRVQRAALPNSGYITIDDIPAADRRELKEAQRAAFDHMEGKP